MHLKPWPDGIATYREFTTLISGRLIITCTCDDCRVTLIKLKFAHTLAQVFQRLANQRKLASIPFFVRLLARASAWNSVWPPTASLCAQVGFSKFATPFEQGLSHRKFGDSNLRTHGLLMRCQTDSKVEKIWTQVAKLHFSAALRARSYQ